MHFKGVWPNTVEKYRLLVFILLLCQICDNDVIAPALFEQFPSSTGLSFKFKRGGGLTALGVAITVSSGIGSNSVTCLEEPVYMVASLGRGISTRGDGLT